MLKPVFSFIFFITIALSSKAQLSFYNIDSIQKIQLFFPNNTWDYSLDTAKLGTDNYMYADSVIVNGVKLDSIGVKYKGSSSYDSNFAKNPLHINLNKFKNQDYLGLTDIKLSNNFKDPSMLREVIAYNILGNYMIAPKANFAMVYINSMYWGLYTNVEAINSTFCKNNFYASGNALIKCNPIANPGPSSKSSLKKLVPHDSSAYNAYYEMKSKTTWQQFYNLVDTLEINNAASDKIIDMDRAIWMMAFDNALANLDSYYGVFSQNYYLYQDNNGRFNPIIWDLNLCFAGFPYLGYTNTSLSQVNIAGLTSLDLFQHNGDIYWPLLNAIYSDSTRKKQYVAHLKTITQQINANNYFTNLSASLHALIDTAVQNDTHKFFTNADFLNSLSTTISVGNYSVPGLNAFVAGRNTYLQSNANFNAMAPVIISFNNSPSIVSFAAPVSITCTTTNATNMYVGFRFATDKIFSKVKMLDDGAHGDGAANDGIYGTTIIANGGAMQYYFYAQNATGGVFSPQEAEFKFHTLSIIAPMPIAKIVRINEALPLNVFGQVDANSEHDDWIELYTESAPLYLGNMYLSDDILNLKKWRFASDAVIKNNGDNYKIVWCDNDIFQKGLHANFKLRSDSMSSIFISDTLGNIIDSVSFNVNNMPDVSYINCNNNYNFNTALSVPVSFNAPNCAEAIGSISKNNFKLYPNPTQGILNIESNTAIKNIMIIDIFGRVVAHKQYSNISNLASVNCDKWPTGQYLISVNGSVVFKKFTKY
jgi:CotH kinase protein/Secretion system C-terminal sorting domain